MATEIVDVEALLAERAAQVSKQISIGGDRIKVTQSKDIKFPDGRTTRDPFDAIIVDFVSVNQFYRGVYDRDEVVPPDCYALGENPSLLVPSERAKDPQAQSCSACPQNQFGSAAKGNGKACKNSRLLALLPPDFTSDTPLWLLRVSPTALRAFDTYVAGILANFNAPPIKVITTIGFDPKQDYPSLRFGNPRPNPRVAEAAAFMQLARQRLLTEPDYETIAAANPAEAPAAPAPWTEETAPQRSAISRVKR